MAAAARAAPEPSGPAEALEDTAFGALAKALEGRDAPNPVLAGLHWYRGIWPDDGDGVPSCVGRLMRDKHVAQLANLISRDERPLLSLLWGDGELGHVFVDKWRRQFLTDLLPILRRLQNGRLKGQENCRVILGQRGVGKTRFLRALIGVALLTSRHDNFFAVSIGGNDTAPGLLQPVAAVHHALTEAGVPELPAGGAWAGVTEMNAWLHTRDINVLVAVDEVERLYVSLNDTHAGALRQLHALGNLNGPRRVSCFVTGSAPTLRLLLFREAGSLEATEYDRLLFDFPGYAHSPDLNSRKFLDVHLFPPSFEHFRAAYEYVTSDDSRSMESTDSEDSASGAGGAAGDAKEDDVEEGDESAVIKEAYIATRGLLGMLKSTTTDTTPTYSRVRRRIGLDNSAVFNALHRLAQATPAAAAFDAPAARLKLADAGLTLEQAYNFNDAGHLALFQPDGEPYITLFCSGDVGAVRAYAAQEEEEFGLTYAEGYSLLHPESTGAADLNEKLVFESLAAKGKDIFGNCVFDEDDRNGEHMVPDPIIHVVDDGVTLLDDDKLGHVRKEIPDHAGADGCCCTKIDDNVRLYRVQVKLGKTSAGQKETSKWQTMMTRGNIEFSNYFRREGFDGPAAQIDVVYWVSRQLSAESRAPLTGTIVDSSTMWGMWSDRVQSFLRRQADELHAPLPWYGEPPAPAAAGAGLG